MSGHRVSRCLSIVLVGVALLSAAPAAAGPEPEPEPEPTPFAYADVAEGHWADEAVAYTAEERDWLTFGGARFHPGWKLRRWQLARAAVRAFAPDAPIDPAITFSDLAPETARYKHANRAVSLGWFPRADAFKPNGFVSKRLLNRVIVLGLGLQDAVAGLNRIATEDGYRFKIPKGFATLVIGNELTLNHNFSSPHDARDLYPWQAVNRGLAAIALHRAAEAGWRLWDAQRYADIVLPTMGEMRKQVVEFAFRWAGYPYIYAAEWHRRAGGQPKGGFDCSGFQWWVAKRKTGGYDAKVRPYDGWTIHQRRASLIAREAPKDRRVWHEHLQPGDLVFFDTGWSDGTWREIDHGGVAVGNGWMMHSSGSRGGVVLSYMGEGSWWRDAFVMGRRMFGPPQPPFRTA